MIDQLESLIAVHQTGTMAAAAVRLRLTPSAISKRIAFLEEQVGYPLAEPKGRKVELTPAALRLIARVSPLVAEIKSVLGDEAGAESGELTIGVTESVLASWGPSFLSQVGKAVPQIKFNIHSHRSPVIVERVRSGEYSVGICAGVENRLAGLRTQLLTKEPMVIIPSGLKKFSPKNLSTLEVISIEAHALSWDLLRPQLRALKELRGMQISVVREIESFSCVVQLAKAGFGHGLAPLGIATSLGVKANQLLHLPSITLHRGVSCVARASTVSRPTFQAFFDSMETAAEKLFVS
jgi:DNA-binding transcriptional LysR family regulator